VKLRVRGDTLRLRLVRSELDELVRTGAVADTIRFPLGRSLTYRLQVDPGADWSAVLDEQGIRVGIPREEASRWFRPDQVGCKSEVSLQGGGTLSLLIEKDFPCLVERPGEDDSDAFPRPEDTPARTC
jgi:Family of unknown function (DUF7009)